MDNNAFMRRTMLSGCAIAIVALSFGRLSYGVIMPFMQNGLSLTYFQAGGLGTANALGYVLTVAFAGPLASRYGNKLIIMSGVFMVSCGLLGMSTVTSFIPALVGMIFTGIGTALTFTPLVSLLINWFPQHRGLVTGVINSAIGFGSVLAGLTVPTLMNLAPAGGWRISWAGFGLAGLIAAAAGLLVLRNPPLSGPVNPDRAVSNSIYYRRDVLLIASTYFLVGFSYIIPATFNMAFMLDSGLPKGLAGIIIAVGGTLSLFSGPAWGFISDKRGRRTILNFTLAATAVGIIIPVINPNPITFIVSAVINGLTLSGVFGLVMARASDLVENRLLPATLSYVTLFFGAGQLFSPSLAGWLIQLQSDFRPVYLLSGAIMAVGIIFSQYVPEYNHILKHKRL